MLSVLAIDAGGTSTRAIIVDECGNCLGFGAAGGGNPISAGFEPALASLAAATSAALKSSPGTEVISSALIAMAGATSRMPRQELTRRFTALGVRGELALESDLLAMFRSGTLSDSGYALIAGTGSVAARVQAGVLSTVSGGAGWLLGDGGSGFWIGHRVARAVVAVLDGRGPDTALTTALLSAVGLTATGERAHGRARVLLDLIDVLYALPPVELSRFAPLAFQARDDAVALEILTTAAIELVDTLAAIRPAHATGPVVLGGSILGTMPGGNPVAQSLASALGPAELIQARDGLVGAAVLGLTRAGVSVDAAMQDRIGSGVARFRQSATTGSTP
ncbi:BadF/BadG/BcrA/BcrD ATPase family protein [Parafrigoribacterium mesophilum]|uniref:N-acetylglucosamine kinase n=1 Tax=Parafrigoribacterium mesophilum TaxID=433646 RepID=UPI0031FDD6FC